MCYVMLSHSLWKASFRLLNCENPLLVTFDIIALTVRKTINKYIAAVAFCSEVILSIFKKNIIGTYAYFQLDPKSLPLHSLASTPQIVYISQFSDSLMSSP